MRPPREPLPLADAPVPEERADAARNRRRILDAAATLFAQQGPGEVTMDDIARTAGVGRATLYRKYATVGAVAEALLDEHERAVQARILRGPPPLGPGASPGERLASFYDAMVDLLEDHSPLVLGAEIGQQRFTTGAYGFWLSHVRHLLEVAAKDDPGVLAELLLAPLDPSLFVHLRRDGTSPAAIAAGLRAMAASVLG